VKFTRYFQEMSSRADRAIIKMEWIQRAIEQPIKEVYKRTVAFVGGPRFQKWRGNIFALYFCRMAKPSTMHFSTGRLSSED
jgi:hypothetical protein